MESSASIPVKELSHLTSPHKAQLPRIVRPGIMTAAIHRVANRIGDVGDMQDVGADFVRDEFRTWSVSDGGLGEEVGAVGIAAGIE